MRQINAKKTTNFVTAIVKKMNRLTTILIALICFCSAGAQVITSIGEQNLKIPQIEKKQVENKAISNDKLPEIDTTSVYYNLIDSAQFYIKKKDWSKAENFIRDAIATEPSNGNTSLLLSNLATLQRHQGKLNDALKNYNMALDMTPNAVTLLMNRASLLVELDSLDLASADYERAIKLDPLQEEARYNHGLIALERRDITAANEDFEEMLRYNPNSLLAHEGLGLVHKATGNYTKAISYLSDVIKKSPSITLLGNRAECYLMTRHLNEASDDINNALQIDSNDGYLYLLRALLNKMRYENQASERDVKLAIDHGIDPTIAREFLEVGN